MRWPWRCGSGVRRHVEDEALTDTLLVYVRGPRRMRQARPALSTVPGVAPDLVPVLERMILEGVREREHLAACVRFLASGVP